MLYRVLAVVAPVVVVSTQSPSLLVSNPNLQNMFVAFTDMFKVAVHFLETIKFQVFPARRPSLAFFPAQLLFLLFLLQKNFITLCGLFYYYQFQVFLLLFSLC